MFVYFTSQQMNIVNNVYLPIFSKLDPGLLYAIFVPIIKKKIADDPIISKKMEYIDINEIIQNFNINIMTPNNNKKIDIYDLVENFNISIYRNKCIDSINDELLEFFLSLSLRQIYSVLYYVANYQAYLLRKEGYYINTDKSYEVRDNYNNIWKNRIVYANSLMVFSKIFK